jgi:hypothetical protein
MKNLESFIQKKEIPKITLPERIECDRPNLPCAYRIHEIINQGKCAMPHCIIDWQWYEKEANQKKEAK